MPVSEKALMEQLKIKVEKEIREREIQVTEYWLGELTKIYDKRHRQMSDLQVDVQGLAAKMRTRMATLKRGAD